MLKLPEITLKMELAIFILFLTFSQTFGNNDTTSDPKTKASMANEVIALEKTRFNQQTCDRFRKFDEKSQSCKCLDEFYEGLLIFYR